MKKEGFERIIFDNYYDDLNLKDVKDEILECEKDEGNSERTIADISDTEAWDKVYSDEEIWFDNIRYELNDFFKNKGDKWILQGIIGRWDGNYRGGFIFETFDEMWNKATKDCDYFKIFDKNGHLYITCSHHDGTNHYEIKRLTKKGIEYLNKNYYEKSDKELHTTIMNNNFFSALPHFAHIVYGLPKEQYRVEKEC